MHLDQMGPLSARSYQGAEVVRAVPDGNSPIERATQEIDYGRRGKGYSFGAFQPATGETLTHEYDSRSAVNWEDLLERV